MTKVPEDKLKSAIAHALKNINDRSLWTSFPTKWHRYGEFDGVRVGAALATNNKPQYDNVALNCDHFDRLRKGNRDGKTDEIYVVATMLNGAGQSEYRAHAEANALYERKLRHMTPRNGKFGPFWSLELSDFDDEDAPF